MAKRDLNKAIRRTFEAFGLDHRKRADWDRLLKALTKARPKKRRGAPLKWTPALRKEFSDAVLRSKILHRLTTQEFDDWFSSKIDMKDIGPSSRIALDAIVANPEFRARAMSGNVPEWIAKLDPWQKPEIPEADLIVITGGVPLPPGKKPFSDTIAKYVRFGAPGSKRKK
jgi:hypothetical protein